MENKADTTKWDNYYINAEKNNTNPPWESDDIFHVLKDWILEEKSLSHKILNLPKDKLKIIELGCGASSSSIWLGENGHYVTAVDFSPEAINRAKKKDTLNKVNWIQCDLLHDNLFENKILIKNGYDLVFDLQCFHVLKIINEIKYSELIYNLLKPGGKLIVVVGALVEPYKKETFSENEWKKINSNGPPKLNVDDFLIPLTSVGLKALSIKLSRFNETPAYGKEPPLCYVGIFEK